MVAGHHARDSKPTAGGYDALVVGGDHGVVDPLRFLTALVDVPQQWHVAEQGQGLSGKS